MNQITVSGWSRFQGSSERRFAARIGRLFGRFPHIFGAAALIFALGAANFIPASAAAAERRVAMILSAERYKAYPDAPIRGEQLESVAQALRSLEFDVEIVTGATNASSRAALRAFVGKARGAKVAVVVLAGHVATWRELPFFLPSNVEISRPTDLLSNGVSVDGVARAAQSASQGVVFFLTTLADLPSTLGGVTARPVMKGAAADNVVIAFSSSRKVPVSQMNNVAQQAARDLVEASAGPEPTLAVLVDAVSAGGAGLVVGDVPEISLTGEPEPAIAALEEEAVSEAALIAAAEPAQAPDETVEGPPDAEREPGAAQATPPSETPSSETPTPESATSETPSEAAAAPELDPALRAFIATLSDAREGDIESLQLIEALLGRSQRRIVQMRLKIMGLYRGRIDSIFGPLTRRAIKSFQRSQEEPQTGYLTPDQLMLLMANAPEEP